MYQERPGTGHNWDDWMGAFVLSLSDLRMLVMKLILRAEG
jgi:hypothetical protein